MEVPWIPGWSVKGLSPATPSSHLPPMRLRRFMPLSGQDCSAEPLYRAGWVRFGWSVPSAPGPPPLSEGGKTGGLARFVSVSGSQNGAMAACTDSAACIFHDLAFTAAPQPPSPGLFINPVREGVGTRALAHCREKGGGERV